MRVQIEQRRSTFLDKVRSGDRTKWYTDKMILDKMVWPKWYGQTGTDKMVALFGIDYNSSEFNTYLVSKSHK